MDERFITATSRRERTARTLLLRMAADRERAERIRQLKNAHPELRWQAIADHVGVTLRAAQAWAQKGEIAYDNAKRLADLFDGVDVDYIMRGRALPPSGTQLDRIESMLVKLDGSMRFLVGVAAGQPLADLLGELTDETTRALLGLDDPEDDEADVDSDDVADDPPEDGQALP